MVAVRRAAWISAGACDPPSTGATTDPGHRGRTRNFFRPHHGYRCEPRCRGGRSLALGLTPRRPPGARGGRSSPQGRLDAPSSAQRTSGHRRGADRDASLRSWDNRPRRRPPADDRPAGRRCRARRPRLAGPRRAISTARPRHAEPRLPGRENRVRELRGILGGVRGEPRGRRVGNRVLPVGDPRDDGDRPTGCLRTDTGPVDRVGDPVVGHNPPVRALLADPPTAAPSTDGTRLGGIGRCLHGPVPLSAHELGRNGPVDRHVPRPGDAGAGAVRRRPAELRFTGDESPATRAGSTRIHGLARTGVPRRGSGGRRDGLTHVAGGCARSRAGLLRNTRPVASPSQTTDGDGKAHTVARARRLQCAPDCPHDHGAAEPAPPSAVHTSRLSRALRWRSFAVSSPST